jgi:hypothetical protein
LPTARLDPDKNSHADLVIGHESDGFVIACWNGISIGVWATQATLELALHLEVMAKVVARDYARNSSIHLVSSGTALPTAGARDKLNALTREYSSQLIGVATVLTGDGFWASAMRSFLTSLHWASSSRRQYETRTCATPGEAAHWLAPLHSAHSVAVDAGELESLLLSLRSRPSVVSVARR